MDEEQSKNMEKLMTDQLEALRAIRKNTSTISTIMSLAVILSILGGLLTMCGGIY